MTELEKRIKKKARNLRGDIALAKAMQVFGPGGSTPTFRDMPAPFGNTFRNVDPPWSRGN